MKRRWCVTLFIALCFGFLGCRSSASPGSGGAAGPSGVLYARTTLHNNFAANPLDGKLIDLLVNAAFSAPTGGGQRSIEFFVVTDREVMKKIQVGHPYSSGLDTAPLVIVVAANTSLARYPELHEMDSGLAAMAMLVQASELGLSSCVLSIAPQAERINSAKSALGMPGNYSPVLMVAFGYPAADATAGASVNMYKESQVHVNRYTGN